MDSVARSFFLDENNYSINELSRKIFRKSFIEDKV